MDKEPQIATGYEEKATWLETFVANYVPKGWKEPISSVMFKPWFSADEMMAMEADFQAGTLREKLLEKYANRPVVVDAILEFFERGQRP